MAKHYSIMSFFRDMPIALLARYFHQQGHFQGLDFSPVDAGELGGLVAAWLELSVDERKRMEGESSTS